MSLSTWCADAHINTPWKPFPLSHLQIAFISLKKDKRKCNLKMIKRERNVHGRVNKENKWFSGGRFLPYPLMWSHSRDDRHIKGKESVLLTGESSIVFFISGVTSSLISFFFAVNRDGPQDLDCKKKKEMEDVPLMEALGLIQQIGNVRSFGWVSKDRSAHSLRSVRSKASRRDPSMVKRFLCLLGFHPDDELKSKKKIKEILKLDRDLFI